MRRARTAAAAVPGELFARRIVGVCGVLVVAACMAFSFGNVVKLGHHLKVPEFVAYLVAPAVDLTVIGLMVGLRHLSLHGATDEELKQPLRMLRAAGVAMWGLNIAHPAFVAGNWGAVAYDSVPPLLLYGWSEIGPWFLRRFRTLTPPTTPTTANRTTAAAAHAAANGAANPTANGTDPDAHAAANGTANGAPLGRAYRLPRTANRQATRSAANGSDTAARERARALWEDSVRTGTPLSGAALGRAAGRSPRWGQKVLAEFQAQPAAAAVGADGAASAPAPAAGGGA